MHHRAVSDVAGVSMRNSEAFGLKETEGEKFRNMVEVIEATNCDLGVGTFQLGQEGRGVKTRRAMCAPNTSRIMSKSYIDDTLCSLFFIL